MDYSVFISYLAGAAALVACSIGAIFWLVQHESRRVDKRLDDLLNER
jgi:hypothetical protein